MSISEAVSDTIKDLHKIGLVDDITMKEFEKLCLPEVKEFTPEEIKKLRKRIKLSQPVFAKYINTATSTVKQWEQGTRKPNGVALKLLNIIQKKGLDVLV